MNTNEILSNFLKGKEITHISERQKSWLLGQANTEKFKVSFDGFRNYIFLQDCHYVIRQCQTHVAGYGGTRGTRTIQGRYILEKMYTIKFESTGLTQVCKDTDIKYYKTTPHAFQIINQL